MKVYVCPWGHARTEAQHDEAKRTPCRICTAYNREAEEWWTEVTVDDFMGLHNAHLEQHYSDRAKAYTDAVMREMHLIQAKKAEPAVGIGAKP